MIRMSVLIGKQVLGKLASMMDRWDKAVYELKYSFAYQVWFQVRQGIWNQAFPFREYYPTSRWPVYKAAHSLDPRKVVATAEYWESIQVLADGNRVAVAAKAPLWRFLEYGTKRSAGFPHYNPAIARVRADGGFKYKFIRVLFNDAPSAPEDAGRP